MDTTERLPPPPLETPPSSPPPPPPETPPSSPSPPPQTPSLNVNPGHHSQIQREKGQFLDPPPPPQSHRPFSSPFSPQLHSILGPRPGIGQSSSINPYQNKGMTEPCFQTQPPIGGAPSHFEQGLMPLDMKPPLPPPPPPAQMQPPIGAYPRFEQGMMPLAPRPPPPPPAQGVWPYCPPAQMMNHPLNVGEFLPWDITVTVAGGETRHINIPYPEGNRVIGLPLSFEVPQVIAGCYEELLRMVQGMRNLITDIVRDFALCQQDAARFWQDANRYYCELEDLKLRMSDNVVAPPGFPTKKRKMIPEEFDPWKVKVAQIHQPKYLQPLSISSFEGSSSAMPACTTFPVQESVAKNNKNDIPITSAKCAQAKFVNKQPLLYCAEMQTETAESLVLVEPVEESVEAMMTSSSPMCQTVKPTMTSSSPLCQTEGIEFLEKFKIPKEYESLYKNIIDKHGNMVPRIVTKSNGDILPALVIRLLKMNSAMETVPVAELSELLIETWEGEIEYAETLEFNIKWLRQKFNEVKKYWWLKEIERHEQELDSAQLKYFGLWAREQELGKEIAVVKARIRNAEAKISSEREAIQEKLAQLYDQIHSEPVTGTVLS